MNIGLPALFVSTLLVTGISVFASQGAYVAKPAALAKPASLFADSASNGLRLGSDQRLDYAHSVAVATINHQTPPALALQSLAVGAAAAVPPFSTAVYNPPKAAVGLVAMSTLAGSIESASAAFAVSARTAPRSEDATAASRVPVSPPVVNAIGIARPLTPPGRSVADPISSPPVLTGNNKVYIEQISLPPVPDAVDQARGESLAYISQAAEFDFSQFEQFGSPQYAKVSEAGSGILAVGYRQDLNSRGVSAVDGAVPQSAPAGSGEQDDNNKSHGDQHSGVGNAGH